MAGDLDMGHARALLPLDSAQQILSANQIVARKLSVREAEKLAKAGDTLDPQSEVSRKIASSKTQTLLESHGTKPNFYVVVQK